MIKADLRNKLINAQEIPEDVMQYVFEQRWLQIWVPKQYCGLGLTFKEGLQLLKRLALIDGSLGWMVTLCAGANYFSRNLKPEIAKAFFKNHSTCFGGSGMIGGTAEKRGQHYLINGTWGYATGAPHLSHFTLNAVLIVNGKELLDAEGNPCIRSFIIPKNQVKIIPDWQSMGMKATGTYSFKVNNVLVPATHSFVYNTFYTDSLLDKIPFRIFADLTLLVNYIGMAQHYIEEAEKMNPQIDLSRFKKKLQADESQVYFFADTIESLLLQNEEDFSAVQMEVHQFGMQQLSKTSHQILELYFQLGINASQTTAVIHQIFRDYFTATQHANFRKTIAVL